MTRPQCQSAGSGPGGLRLDQSHDRLGPHTVVFHRLRRLVGLQALLQGLEVRNALEITPTRFEFPGSRNVRVVMPIGPKNSSRFGDAAQ